MAFLPLGGGESSYSLLDLAKGCLITVMGEVQAAQVVSIDAVWQGKWVLLLPGREESFVFDITSAGVGSWGGSC